MGILQEKYTEEYFTGTDKCGNPVGYGAEKVLDVDGRYVLREHDLKIVEKIEFAGKDVLEFGVGRGECARFVLQKNVSSYVGVDFAEAALSIAKRETADCEIQPTFFHQDAYEFVKNITTQPITKFDIVIMFDFVEHIPREELREIFILLKQHMKEKSLLIINTPAYKYDNDVILEGLNSKNNDNTIDTSDLHEATAGMHCNKYSVISLQTFLRDCGFDNITEAHFFAPHASKEKKFFYKSYKDDWDQKRLLGYPLCKEYSSDEIEYAYKIDKPPVLTKFESGMMAGLQLYCTDFYKNLAYENGNYDLELFENFNKISIKKTVIDVGGFVGVNSLLFSKNMMDGQIFVFEPNPWNFNRIRKNISLNEQYSDKINIINIGLGEKEDKTQMILSSDIDVGYSSTSRIEEAHSKIRSEKLPSGFQRSEILIRDLDSIVEENSIFPDVIKVDIEGAEHLFLLGAKKTLTKYKPIIYMEIHSEFCAIQCMKFFHQIGYTVLILHEDEDNRLLVKAFSEKNANAEENVMEYLVGAITNIKHSCQLFLKQNENSLKKEYEQLREQISVLKTQYEVSEKYKELEVEKEILINENRKLVEENLLIKKELNKIYNSKGWNFLSVIYKIKSML